MTLAHPWLLLALLLLPLLWWLLRATPPAPQLQDFPAIRLLMGLAHREEEQSRTPPWLLALRIAAVLALVLGLAAPRLERADAGGDGAGRMLLVIDDGWQAEADWPAFVAAADRVLAHARAGGRPVSLLTTAPGADGVQPGPTAFLPADRVRALVDGLQPHPWTAGRGAAARTLAGFGHAAVTYLSDGVAEPGDEPFAAALRGIGPVAERLDPGRPALLMLPPVIAPDGLTAMLAADAPIPPATMVLALDRRGDALARARVSSSRASGGTSLAGAAFRLPTEMRNRLAGLVVEGARDAASTRLLDDSDRIRPVGILSDGGGTDLPLVGPTYYLERALPPSVELRRGTLDALLARPLSVLFAVDRTLADPAGHARLERWVRDGGTLVRFAGPRLAASDQASGDDGAQPGPAGDATDAAAGSDPLLPVPLLPGARALGGAMSWAKPQHLAPFPAGSPFQGLQVPSEVTVTRQVLARPSIELGHATWVALADGTPLVTARRLGQGRVVLFHVTANAEWSSLPLSGLFVQMLGRLESLAAGVPAGGDRTLLEPVSVLDASGLLVPPGPAVGALAADRFGTVPAGPLHPPGLYGRLSARRALNVADASPLPVAARAFGAIRPMSATSPGLEAGPLLLGLGLLLLSLDLLLSLRLRGLLARPWRRSAAAPLLLALALLPLPVPGTDGSARALESGTSPQAALQTELAYVVTGNDETDRISREGLAALSDDVNARTAAVLGPPAPVVPGRDDLAFYPLIYWPILPGATADPRANAALDRYMRNGGVVLIDTEGADASDPDGGSGTGFAPGARAALRRVAVGLDIPPLEHLQPGHVLAHSFYLLRDFPGRFAGAPVWVSRGNEADNDGVSPVILGSNDWAAAWAAGPDGAAEFSPIPGGEQQRATALRFGVNLVMYALTGNYKADQVHVPALLRRMGGDRGADPDAVGGAGP